MTLRPRDRYRIIIARTKNGGICGEGLKKLDEKGVIKPLIYASTSFTNMNIISPYKVTYSCNVHSLMVL